MTDTVDPPAVPDLTEPVYEGIGRSRATDYFHIGDQLTDDERDYWRRARHFVDDEVLPVINTYWEQAEFPWPLITALGQRGLVGDGIEGYGGLMRPRRI